MIVYEGRTHLPGQRGRVVGVITGTDRPSENEKTGPMAQLWILPTRGIMDDHDVAVCGDCALRDNGCYVVKMHGPTAVYRKYERGEYGPIDWLKLHRKPLRLGAWGDPLALPWQLIRRLTEVAGRWTGYTHQWDKPGAYLYRPYLMASVETEEAQKRAQDLGWRTFRITKGEPEERIVRLNGKREMVCHYHTFGLRCIDCNLCNGWGGESHGRSVPMDRINVSIPAHGTSKVKVHS